VDKAVYKCLDKDSNIWVSKEQLQAVQKSARDMVQYASCLMWHVLIPSTERLRLLDVKVEKGGFVKMFGRNRIDAVHRKLSYKFPQIFTQNFSIRVVQ